MSSPRRRDFAAALGGTLALARCARRPRLARVLAARAPAYSQDLYGQVRRVLAELRLDVRGKRVLLKPNLVEFDAATSINTHPMFVHAVWEAMRSMGVAEVRIGEGPGHRRGTLDLAEAAGYFEYFPRFESQFTDLNLDDIAHVRIRHPASRLSSLYLPATALAADLIVSLPKMKTHHWVGATLGLKNLFGLVPGGVYGWPKNVLHWAGIDECIADLGNLFPRTFTLVDGIVGMEGNGPIQGRPKPAGVVVAGRDPAAVDATCCRIMDIDPARIRYLSLLAGAGIDERNVQQIGEPLSAVRAPFALLPRFNYLRLERSGS